MQSLIAGWEFMKRRRWVLLAPEWGRSLDSNKILWKTMGFPASGFNQHDSSWGPAALQWVGSLGLLREKKRGRLLTGWQHCHLGSSFSSRSMGHKNQGGCCMVNPHRLVGSMQPIPRTQSSVQFLPVTKLKTTNPLQSLVPEFGYRTFGIILELTAQTGNVVT